jgi:hypothetical protein
MKAKRGQRRIHPRTVQEAEQLRNLAIEKIDFESAAAYQEDVDGIALLDREGQLGEVATDYLREQSRLADSLERDRAWFDERTAAQMEVARREFDSDFQELARYQHSELSGLFQSWRTARQDNQSRADGDLKLQLEVAKELARRCKFKDAMDTRDKAFHQKTVQLSQSSAEVDAHYENLIQLMMTRHQTALDSFVRERHLELNTHETLKTGVATRASEAFAIDNARTVFELARGSTTAKVQMPLSFAYQTVQGKEQKLLSPAEDSEVDELEHSATLREGFAPLAQNVLTPCPLRKSKSPIAKDPNQQRKREEARKRKRLERTLETPHTRFMPKASIFMNYARGETTESAGFQRTPDAARSGKSTAKRSPSVETPRRRL